VTAAYRVEVGGIGEPGQSRRITNFSICIGFVCSRKNPARHPKLLNLNLRDPRAGDWFCPMTLLGGGVIPLSPVRSLCVWRGFQFGGNHSPHNSYSLCARRNGWSASTHQEMGP
jgi:hypothetical protein